jgi:hypothetical protein
MVISAYYSQIPTITCEDCGENIEWRHEYTHICGEVEYPPTIPLKDFAYSGKGDGMGKYINKNMNRLTQVMDDSSIYSQQQESGFQNYNDTNDGPFCLNCGKIVSEFDGYEIEVFNGWFHADCFNCNVCQRPFDDEFPFVPHEGKVFCEVHYEELFLPTCAACQKPITDGNISHAFGRTFHARHLRVIIILIKCNICKQRIRGPHIEHNGKVFCQEDYDNLTNSDCSYCKKPIDGPSVAACGKVFHKECLGCTICRRPFPDKKFYAFEGNPYCLLHYHEVSNTICGRCKEPIQGNFNC